MGQMFRDKITQLVEFVWRRTNERFEEGMAFEDAAQIELTPEYFEELRRYKAFQSLLRDLDVADEDQLDLFDTLDVDGGGTIDLEEFVCGIAKLRGDARRSDIVSVGLVLRSMQSNLHDLSEKLNAFHTEGSGSVMAVESGARSKASSRTMKSLTTSLAAT